jgi:hypothetical protein
MPDEISSAQAEARTIWLSGAILTLLNKLLFPVAWLALIAGVPLWVYATVGRIHIAPNFEFIVWFAVIATAPLLWLTAHLQLVGYSGHELVVANYWREARIPFKDIQAVEPVWWFKGRLVRVRFAGKTPFGSIVYYMPKWGPARAMFSAPEEELRRAIGKGRDGDFR